MKVEVIAIDETVAMQPDASGRRFTLLDDFVTLLDIDGRGEVVKVPKGFETDLASVPHQNHLPIVVPFGQQLTRRDLRPVQDGVSQTLQPSQGGVLHLRFGQSRHAVPRCVSRMNVKAGCGSHFAKHETQTTQAHGRGRENAARERIWFSPHCLRPGGLFA